MSRDRIIQLQECAEELGFETIQQALDAGYHEVQDLVSGTFTLEKVGNMVELEKAHEAWLKYRDEVVAGLNSLIEMEEFQKKMLGDDYIDTGEMEILTHAVRFIKEQCHD